MHNTFWPVVKHSNNGQFEYKCLQKIPQYLKNRNTQTLVFMKNSAVGRFISFHIFHRCYLTSHSTYPEELSLAALIPSFEDDSPSQIPHDYKLNLKGACAHSSGVARGRLSGLEAPPPNNRTFTRHTHNNKIITVK